MNFKQIVVAAALLGSAALTSASVIVLDFEGAGDYANLLDFYNGGTDSLGNSGTNYGVQFGANTLALIDSDAGGSGNFANESTPDTIMFFLTGSSILNYAPGFSTGFSFFYTSAYASTVNVYDGLNATGNLLGSINLSAQSSTGCGGDPSGSFCNFSGAGVSFAGVAKSIDFTGTANYVGFDNITFGSDVPVVTSPVPEPEIYAMLLGGLGLTGAWARRNKKK